MKKLIVILLASSLAACGGGDDSCSTLAANGDNNQISCSAGGNATNEQDNSVDSELATELERACRKECIERGNNPVDIEDGDCFKECLEEEKETLEP